MTCKKNPPRVKNSKKITLYKAEWTNTGEGGKKKVPAN